MNIQIRSFSVEFTIDGFCVTGSGTDTKTLSSLLNILKQLPFELIGDGKASQQCGSASITTAHDGGGQQSPQIIELMIPGLVGVRSGKQGEGYVDGVTCNGHCTISLTVQQGGQSIQVKISNADADMRGHHISEASAHQDGMRPLGDPAPPVTPKSSATAPMPQAGVGALNANDFTPDGDNTPSGVELDQPQQTGHTNRQPRHAKPDKRWPSSREG